ncbi:MAG: hypothetical protein JXA19_02230 [Anaerolineales bacterium]|nr:hypothetical protein [Anaerolineales bacterium]
MLTTGDLITWQYTPDLSNTGLLWVLNHLDRYYSRYPDLTPTYLKTILIQRAVELAFRRMLVEKLVPHSFQPARNFLFPDLSDLHLGGRKCIFFCNTIEKRENIQQVLKHPSRLLQGKITLSAEELFQEPFIDQDICIIAFVLGLSSSNMEDTKKAFTNNLPVHLIHLLPADWAQPTTSVPLGRIALKTDSPEALSIQLIGKDIQKNILQEKIILQQEKRTLAPEKFLSILAVYLESPVSNKVGLSASGRKDMLIIQPWQWTNLWFYGMRIFFIGYTKRGNYRKEVHSILPDDIQLEVNTLSSLTALCKRLCEK